MNTKIVVQNYTKKKILSEVKKETITTPPPTNKSILETNANFIIDNFKINLKRMCAFACFFYYYHYYDSLEGNLFSHLAHDFSTNYSTIFIFLHSILFVLFHMSLSDLCTCYLIISFVLVFV